MIFELNIDKQNNKTDYYILVLCQYLENSVLFPIDIINFEYCYDF